MKTELPWIAVARRLIGQREIAGTKHNPLVLKMWGRIRAPFTDDETPWCAAFVGSCLEEVGIRSTRSARALSYLTFGNSMPKPLYGCIAVKQRKGGGHVTFVVGRTKDGNLLCLGGNQNDMVAISEYPADVFSAFRWPLTGVGNEPATTNEPQLPVFASAAKATTEA
jgi:uncharacterized protein (TIGR02594 family)